MGSPHFAAFNVMWGPHSCRCDIGVVATIEKITAAEKINTSHVGRFCD
jgi:hypothetical protein